MDRSNLQLPRIGSIQKESCLFLVNQMRGISALPVMGAKESLSVDLAGIARLLQIVTCAQSATWLIAIIKGTRLSALTRDGAKVHLGQKNKNTCFP